MSNLSKCPQKGEKITLVWLSGVVLTVVQGRSGKTFRVKWQDTLGFGTRKFSVRRRDEGKTWARGHDTPAANALRTVVTLRSEP